MIRRVFVAAAVLAAGLGGPAVLGGPAGLAAEGFEVEQTDHGVVVEWNGRPFASYVVDQTNKPYLWPVYGPTGKAMTRAYPMAEVPGEPKGQRDHPHHRGITFGHEDFGGDTWHDAATFAEKLAKTNAPAAARERAARLARIRHREFTRIATEGDAAVVASVCEHLDGGGARRVTEYRRFTFRADADTRVIDVDQDFVATDGPVTAADKKDAGLYVRVPATMAVDMKQGGRIVNAVGQTDAAAWAQPAAWCDYHGPVEGEHLGVAILNHPESFRHPTRWHVRTYGLFAANPFAAHGYDESLPESPTTLAPGETLRLRHRIILHRGDERAADIASAFRAYAAEPRPPVQGPGERP